jgi:hypothetical protein
MRAAPTAPRRVVYPRDTHTLSLLLIRMRRQMNYASADFVQLDPSVSFSPHPLARALGNFCLFRIKGVCVFTTARTFSHSVWQHEANTRERDERRCCFADAESCWEIRFVGAPGFWHFELWRGRGTCCCTGHEINEPLGTARLFIGLL